MPGLVWGILKKLAKWIEFYEWTGTNNPIRIKYSKISPFTCILLYGAIDSQGKEWGSGRVRGSNLGAVCKYLHFYLFELKSGSNINKYFFSWIKSKISLS